MLSISCFSCSRIFCGTTMLKYCIVKYFEFNLVSKHTHFRLTVSLCLYVSDLCMAQKSYSIFTKFLKKEDCSKGYHSRLFSEFI